MKIFVVHKLEDQDGEIHSSIRKAYTNEELAVDGLKEEVRNIEKSFNENGEEYEKIDFLDGYELRNDETDILIVINEIDLEGSLFVLNELNQLEQETYNECIGVFSDSKEAWKKANKQLDEAEEQLGSCDRNDDSVSTDNSIVTEVVKEIKL